MLKSEGTQLPQKQDHIRWLYQKYSASLYGYICEIVPDQNKSEEYLINILSHFAIDHRIDLANGEVSWAKLMRYARALLQKLRGNAEPAIALENTNEMNRKVQEHLKLALLNSFEREIFYEIYYNGQSVESLAQQHQKKEEVIRSSFKISFDKIRSASGN